MMTTNEEGLSPCQFNENEMMTKKEVKLHDTKRERWEKEVEEMKETNRNREVSES